MVRIEHKDSQFGAFCAKNALGSKNLIYFHSRHETILNRHSDMDVFPSFRHDTSLYTQFEDLMEEIENYRFAFKSLEQFYSAFEVEEVKEFITLGFEVFYIEATETVESPYQIVFKPENVTLKQNISNLFV